MFLGNYFLHPRYLLLGSEKNRPSPTDPSSLMLKSNTEVGTVEGITLLKPPGDPYTDQKPSSPNLYSVTNDRPNLNLPLRTGLLLCKNTQPKKKKLTSTPKVFHLS